MSGPTTEGELREMGQRARHAAPGPWHADGDRVLAGAGASEDWSTESSTVAQGMIPVDTAFIAHARADVPRLLEEVRRLRGQPGRAETDSNHSSPGPHP